MVTMNPGAPDQRQQSLRRRDLSRIEMHSDYERGLLEYHRQPRGGGIGDLFEFVRGITGLTQSEIYYTELAKCVSKGLQPSDERRILRTCSEEHFTRELEAFSGSLKYVICFGRAAFRMTVRAISSSPGLRQLGDRGRLGYVRHPSPLAGSAMDFRRALEETLGEATRECRFPGTGEPTSSPAS
jgi:hypothetical protein